MNAEPRAELVLLCAVKPTQTLLAKVVEALPKELDVSRISTDIFCSFWFGWKVLR
jgi:hypothetical protein